MMGKERPDNTLAAILGTAFREEYYRLKGDWPNVEQDISLVPYRELVQVGGYAGRDPLEVSPSDLRDVADAAGREAARYLLRAEPLGLEDYKQGVLVEWGIDEVPMPAGVEPYHVSIIIKALGNGGPADPINPNITIGWKCYCKVVKLDAT